ncbi:GNAT family N-acetyltransferase [Streptomyces sp. NPDC054838]
MAPVHIVRAVAQDAERLTALIQASRAYRGRYASMIAGYHVAPEYVSRHQVFMATGPSGRLLGFYALVLDTAELDLAFVSDQAQGLGVGRLLVEHMIVRARLEGLDEVRVVSHPPAEGFYRRLGAERIGTVPSSPPKVTWERPELRFRTG